MSDSNSVKIFSLHRFAKFSGRDWTGWEPDLKATHEDSERVVYILPAVIMGAREVGGRVGSVLVDDGEWVDLPSPVPVNDFEEEVNRAVKSMIDDQKANLREAGAQVEELVRKMQEQQGESDVLILPTDVIVKDVN